MRSLAVRQDRSVSPIDAARADPSNDGGLLPHVARGRASKYLGVTSVAAIVIVATLCWAPLAALLLAWFG